MKPGRVGNLDKSGKSETVGAPIVALRPVIGVPHPLGTSKALHVGLSTFSVRHLKHEGDTSVRELTNLTLSSRTHGVETERMSSGSRQEPGLQIMI